MPYRKVIIGLGSGRCGTMSLQRLLNSQGNSKVTHENLPIPWDNEPDVAEQRIEELLELDADIIGDVGYYWLNHVERMLQAASNTKFICLKRKRQEVIESMWAFSRGLNVHPIKEWYRMYPRYDTDRKTAIGLMWDDYYIISERLQEKHPGQFRIWDTDALNSKTGVEAILDFVEIPKENQVVQVGIKLNKRI
ncbi:hypothetical protein LCGC14_0614710 [marine sediment metagenome]|uniref:Sulfotransferase domain-containing protein n=1 Tax=marine sediment metagenome TaxID=412755 RepID=A0A0F9TT02_9ZZZZ